VSFKLLDWVSRCQPFFWFAGLACGVLMGRWADVQGLPWPLAVYLAVSVLGMAWALPFLVIETIRVCAERGQDVRLCLRHESGLLDLSSKNVVLPFGPPAVLQLSLWNRGTTIWEGLEYRVWASDPSLQLVPPAPH
jgi:hypothetical protein